MIKLKSEMSSSPRCRTAEATKWISQAERAMLLACATKNRSHRDILIRLEHQLRQRAAVLAALGL
jgi:hypothetical protein